VAGDVGQRQTEVREIGSDEALTGPSGRCGGCMLRQDERLRDKREKR
jgi:hypothetical protein